MKQNYVCKKYIGLKSVQTLKSEMELQMAHLGHNGNLLHFLFCPQKTNIIKSNDKTIDSMLKYINGFIVRLSFVFFIKS